jgi:hypothetical protein
MMVPMMVNPDTMAGGQPGATTASYPQAMMPQMMAHPYMMPQMPAPTTGHHMMMPQMPAPTATHHMMMPQMMYMPQAPPPPMVAPQAPPPPQQQQVQQQAQQQQTQQQTDGQPKTGQQPNVSGGNLAHCA